MIAVGIGLHGFAEGLAIGNSAASGEIPLAVLLIIGSILYVVTELLAVARRTGLKELTSRMILLGFATDAVVTTVRV